MVLLSGTKLGRYEIRSKIGEGGMGEVYLARDTELDRKLALKILPAELAANQDRMRRFVLEAKAAAALNHPNIAHIYEIGHQDAVHFIAMEFVDGVTLREKIGEDQTNLSKLLRYLRQVAEGLSKAHAAGIVHRDLKPDNVMITDDGHAKILDFGLAKLIEQRPASISGQGSSEVATAVMPQHSTPGMVMGTIGYMSPEQAQGKTREIDHRSDIFSFGCILFEAATGQKAFAGKDVLDSLHNIVHAPTPIIKDLNPVAPDDLQRIVRRCLAKDPDKRYQSIKEVAIELEDLRQELQNASELHDSVHQTAAGATASGSNRTQATSATSLPLDSLSTRASSAEYIVEGVKRNKKIILAVLGLILFAGAAFAIYRYLLKPKPSHFERVELTRITTEGNLQSVAVSPDGKYIAYTLLEAGKRSVWTKHLATDSRVQIVAPAEATLFTPYFFSHDGGYVFYGQQDAQNPAGALFQVAVLGGTPKRILTNLAAHASLSPNGKSLAFTRYRPGAATEQYEVWLADADGANERRLWACSEPKWLHFNGVSWSPDGKLLTVDYGSDEGGDHMTVATIAVSDGAFKVITPHRWLEVGRIVWFGDGSGMAVLAMESESNNWQIWRMSYPKGEVQRITNDLHNYGNTSLTLTADSHTLVALQLEMTRNIFVAPDGDAKRARAVTSRQGLCEGCGGIDWTPDGRLVYSSNVGGALRIWVMNADGSDQKPLIELGEHGDSPRVSPDGRYIFYLSRRSKTVQVWRMEIDGTRPLKLTEGTAVGSFALTPDGHWVVYSLYAPGIWKVPADGGPASKISDASTWSVEVSPDGQFLALVAFIGQTTQPRISIHKFNDLTPFKILDLPLTAGSKWCFSSDSRAIIYSDTRGATNLWRLPLDGSPARQITDFNADVMSSFAYARDGKQLALSRGRTTRDAVLITEEK